MSVEQRPRNDDVWLGRAASASGIAFAVLAFIAFLLTGRPEEQASNEEIVQFFADKQSEIEWQALLFGLAAVAFLWFSARLAQLIRVASGPSGDRTASLVISGGAASTALFLAGAAAFGAVAEGDDASPTMFDFGDLAFGLSTFTAAAFVAGASAGIARGALLERWIGWTGGVLVGLLLLNGIVRTLVAGETGAALGTISFVALLGWVLVVSALLTLRHERYAAWDRAADDRVRM